MSLFSSNPDYGSGRYRRRIQLRRVASDQVDAELEDCNHRFAIQVRHDQRLITDIHAATPRIPFDSCPGAAHALRALIGHALPDNPGELALTGQPRSHCTHLFDLLELALNHRLRDNPLCQYDVIVEDEREELQDAAVLRDGVEVHRWPILRGQLQAPLSDAGQRLLGGGFGRWAAERFTGEALEAAHVLQRGYLVAQARRYNVDGAAGRNAADDPMPAGACFTYQPEQAATARRLGDSVRDFSDPDQPLLAAPALLS